MYASGESVLLWAAREQHDTGKTPTWHLWGQGGSSLAKAPAGRKMQKGKLSAHRTSQKEGSMRTHQEQEAAGQCLHFPVVPLKRR